MQSTPAYTPSRPEPWSLTRVPHYHDARGIESIPADSISEEAFRATYVDTNTPVLLTGAAKHWAGCGKWNSVPYLKQRTTRFASASVNYVPIPEHVDDPTNCKYVRFHDFLEKLATTKGFIRGVGQMHPNGGLAGLIADLGTYPFLSALTGSQVYQTYRFMLYRQSYSDWHCHLADETLMTQVVGSKEILLLPPDDQSWNTLMPIVEKQGRLFDVDVNAFPDFANVHPYRVVSHEGDALYIPVFWWHAVEATSTEIGATVAATWGTPPHILSDTRFPAVRDALRRKDGADA